MRILGITLLLLAALAAGYVGSRIGPVQTAQQQETVYDRVMRTKILRCGWFAEPPFTNYNANSGERSGIVPDIVAVIAADYGLKVEWKTISNFAMMGEDLKQGKYDAICASLINMPRGGLIDSVDAFAYAPLYGYVRANETRLTSLAQVNDPQYRIAVQEGAAVTTITKKKLPFAQQHVIPSADLAEEFTSVVDSKADVVFALPTFYQQFLQDNPGTLKPLNNAHPLQLFAFAFGVKPQEDGLKTLINGSLHRLVVSGDLAALYAKYDPQGILAFPTVSTSK